MILLGKVYQNCLYPPESSILGDALVAVKKNKELARPKMQSPSAKTLSLPPDAILIFDTPNATRAV